MSIHCLGDSPERGNTTPTHLQERNYGAHARNELPAPTLHAIPWYARASRTCRHPSCMRVKEAGTASPWVTVPCPFPETGKTRNGNPTPCESRNQKEFTPHTRGGKNWGGRTKLTNPKKILVEEIPSNAKIRTLVLLKMTKRELAKQREAKGKRGNLTIQVQAKPSENRTNPQLNYPQKRS